MSTIAQTDFSGGMSSLFDSTKGNANQYRIGLNVRIRKNAIEGAFKPIKHYSAPGNHQAIFPVDDKLLVVIDGTCHRLVDGRSFAPIQMLYTLDPDAEYIYHEAIPTPTNFFVGETYTPSDINLNEPYSSVIATFNEGIVLQDGINQPILLHATLANRRLKTYNQWSFQRPEYVPIGKQMASSGNKLFIYSPNGKKIYQSVTGRQLDFVLNMDNDGNKRGDADTSNLAVSASKGVALVPAQSGGVIAFTKYKAYELYPIPEVDRIFGEIYLHPRDVFPVGAVNHLSFSFINGESVFVSPQGIQQFNQVMQTHRASNNNPLGAPIIDYLIRPVVTTATTTVNDYTLFAVSTVFGDGILVYDSQVNTFVSFDIVGKVKEFAVIEDNGLPRCFFITYENEIYEMPLYTGARTKFYLYMGDLNTGQPNASVRPTDIHLGFTNVRAAGDVTLESYVDHKLIFRGTKNLATERPTDSLLEQAPRSIPLQGDTEITRMSFELSETKAGYAFGHLLACSADARLVSAAHEMDTSETNLVGTPGGVVEPKRFSVVGNIKADSVLHNVTAATVTVGKTYVLMSLSGATQLRDGDQVVTTKFAGDAAVFVARTDRIIMEAIAYLLDYESFLKILDNANGSTALIIPGNAGFYEQFWHLRRIFDQRKLLVKPVAGNADMDISSGIPFFSTFEVPEYYIYSTPQVNFYCISFFLETAAAAIDVNGALDVTPIQMQSTGFIANWLKYNCEQNRDKFNVVVFPYPPYSDNIYSPGYVTLRWPFRQWGIHAVLSGRDPNYFRIFQDSTYYVNIGTGGYTLAGENGLSVFGHLELHATSNLLQGEFHDTDNVIRDRFSITR